MSSRVSVRIHSDQRFGLAAVLAVAVLVAGFLGYLLWGQARSAVGIEAPQPTSAPRPASAAAVGGVRQYYQTWSFASGSGAASACAAGYHMASVWELIDTSNLEYNTALGRTQADSGAGPPTFYEGWARTGYKIGTTNVAGQGNCNGWTSSGSGDSGTSLYLPHDWTVDQDLSTWITGTWSCDTTMPVWCVTDPYSGGAVSGIRYYYLTSSSDLIGSQPTTAWASGYHMASLWEIVDPSNLRYNVSLGESRSDSGMGPPSGSLGWIRTGFGSHNGITVTHEAGRPNCSAWSSGSSGNYGTVVELPTDWTDAEQQDVFVWDAWLRRCSETAPVWCVADTVVVGVCNYPLRIGCGQTIDGDTSIPGFASNIDSYTCSAWNESGPEAIYAFTLAAGSIYTVTAEISNMPDEDLDVFLLSSAGCASGQCLGDSAYGDTIATMGPLAPGTYYVAVDGYLGVSDSYTLELTCTTGAGEKIYLPLVLRNY